MFFKELKQMLQLADFMGYNENAVRRQIWTALLTYILLRFIARQSKLGYSFARLFIALRGVLWRCLDVQCFCLPGFTPIQAWLKDIKNRKLGYGKFNNQKFKTKQKASEFRNYGMIVKDWVEII